MKIGIFTELYFPSIGGMEVRYKELSKALIDQGHQVTVYCIGHVKNLKYYETINGVEIYRYPIVKNYKEPFIKPLKRAVVPLLRYSAWASKVMSTEHFDFIIFNQWPLFHVLLAPSSARSHCVLDWCEIRFGKFYSFCQTFLPKLTASNMAVSPFVCEHIQQFSERPVYFLPSGIDLSQYHSLERSQRKSILCIGRVAEHKNLPLLVEAFELLKDSGYLDRLIIAGDGPAFETVSAQVAASRHKDFIDLLGLVSEAEKIRLLSEAELLVIPSKREGFPQVVVEAMASGLPIVTTEFPENGTAGVLSHYGSGLVSQPTPTALSTTITLALSNWENYSKACLDASKELDWSLLAKSFEQNLITKVKS